MDVLASRGALPTVTPEYAFSRTRHAALRSVWLSVGCTGYRSTRHTPRSAVELIATHRGTRRTGETALFSVLLGSFASEGRGGGRAMGARVAVSWGARVALRAFPSAGRGLADSHSVRGAPLRASGKGGYYSVKLGDNFINIYM